MIERVQGRTNQPNVLRLKSSQRTLYSYHTILCCLRCIQRSRISLIFIHFAQAHCNLPRSLPRFRILIVIDVCVRLCIY